MRGLADLADRIQAAYPASQADGLVRRDLFGHPKGLAFLFTTEMWERFSYYGMRSLLVLYMTKYLLLPQHAGDVIGLAGFKSALEAIFGRLEIQPLSSQIFGFYTALVYFTPIFGGLLADRVFGQRRMVIVGAILMAIGHFMMAVEQLFLFALLALILGNGAFKPNISTQVGGLYAPGDRRRDRAYSIFYVGINVGAFLAPLVCGTLGEEAGWHYGFGAAGAGMLIGLCIYLYALPLLPAAVTPSLPASEESEGKASAARTGIAPLRRDEWRAAVALLVLFVPTALFWATYEQSGNTIVLWADANTDRTVGLFGASGEIPTTWFLAFNPFMIFAFTPFVVTLWTRQAARGAEPSTITKMSLGCFGVTFSYLIMAFAAWQAGGGKASWSWLFAYFVVITIAELYLSPVGLSLVTKIAPVRILSMMMGVWLSTSFVGGFLAGYIGSFWSRMQKPEFFLLIAAIAMLAGAAIFACRRLLRGMLRE
jgi:POT family proton-dependent oligopeptide transporter